MDNTKTAEQPEPCLNMDNRIKMGWSLEKRFKDGSLKSKEGSLPTLEPNIKESHAGRIVEGVRPRHKEIHCKEVQPLKKRSSTQEKRLKTDNSIQLTKTHQFPKSTYVFLEMVFSNRTFEGSGQLIGPYHVLTCGHNIYDVETKKWADQISAFPGADGKKTPFGEIPAVKAFIPMRWTSGDNEADIGLILLEKEIGEETGWASFASWQDEEFNGVELSISGYPGDKLPRTLHETKGIILEKTGSMLFYNISTFKGLSGSSVWRKGNFPVIVGVHCRGGPSGKQYNEGTRISDEYFDWIVFLLEMDHSYPSNYGSVRKLINLKFPDGTKYFGQWEKSWREGEGVLIEANGDRYIGQFHRNKRHGQGTEKCFNDRKIYIGKWKKDQKEGLGTELEANGDRYDGYFKNNERDGQGESHYSNEKIYFGQWKKGKREGQGILTYPNGSRYKGSFYKNKRHGQGTYTYTFSDEKEYVGEWRYGKKEGLGTLTWSDGSWYQGKFYDDFRNGQGTYNSSDGTTYTGEWKNGKKEGHGIETSANDDHYDGEFKNNYKDGQGEYKYSSGKVYFGQWKKGKREGQGIVTYPNGSRYRGSFYKNKRHGQGIYESDKKVYTGEWRYGKKERLGTLPWSDGRRYEGKFVNDCMHGQGTLRLPDGSTITGNWKNDQIQDYEWNAPEDDEPEKSNQYYDEDESDNNEEQGNEDEFENNQSGNSNEVIPLYQEKNEQRSKRELNDGHLTYYYRNQFAGSKKLSQSQVVSSRDKSI